MAISILTWSVFVLAAIPAALFLINLSLYRRPKPVQAGVSLPVSILIPARNEERSIGTSVRAALASRNVDLEIVVLDDHSEDGTSEIVRRIAAEDPRVRLEVAPPLPPGWCGKQFACSVLSTLAAHPILCLIDADVRLSENGLAEMIGAMRTLQTSLISGFPWQDTRSPLEQLLLPLMHFLLLGYLPMIGMRNSVHPAFAAGCGQIFVADRVAYEKAGGHAAIRNSRHDGITLPRAFRRAGFKTDLCDATNVASCRMYTNSREVLSGLLKNATEGLASPGRIIPFSILLFLGEVVPLFLFVYLWNKNTSHGLTVVAGTAAVLSYLPRVISVFRFRQSALGALFHPFGILGLLAIQWFACLRAVLGVPSTWKGRRYSTT